MLERYSNKNFFIVNRSKIEGRIDPHQFHYERVEAISKIKLNNEVIKLKKAVKNVKSTTSTIKHTDIYIGLENVESDTGKYIETSEKNTISSAGIFRKGNILFPKLRPYLNKVHLAEFDGICSTEFHIFNSSKNYLNEFMAIYLRTSLIVNQTKHLMTGNTLPRLQTEDINNLPIPNISIEKQTSIVKFYNKKIELKIQKETEAKSLVNSIHAYLLSELGLNLPEQNKAISNRIFTVSSSEIGGRRIDPYYFFNKSFRIEGGTYRNLKLKNIAILIKGKSITSDKVIRGDYPVIAGGQVSPYSHNEYNFNGNIITISASGAYSGYVWYHDYPIFASDCTVIRSKDDRIISTLFLAEILKVKQKEIYNLQQGAGQPHVYAKDLEKLNIPLPPIEKQNEIINKISTIRKQAQQLQEEAVKVLEDTQIQIQQIIVG